MPFKRFDRRKCFLTIIALLIWASSSVSSSQVHDRVDFRRDVQPLLKQHCLDCHGPSQQMKGFRLDRRREAMRGSTRAVITPGNSAASLLYLKLLGNQFGPQMPPTGSLSSEQIEIIKAWIDQGAVWPDDLSGDLPLPPPDPKAAPLLAALRDGDQQAFQKLIRADPKVGNLKGPGGTTPLMQAALYGNVESVRLLLENGADPNLGNEAGATALMWAVDDLEKTRLLVAHGADVNARSKDGRTPLLIAAGRPGSEAVIRLLLERGASLAVKSPGAIGDATPLSEAARVGNEALLRMLIERGAEVKSAGILPLANADRAKCAKCLDLLLEQTDRKSLTRAALQMAPPLGDAQAIKTLLERGADAGARDPKGNTLLMLAASSDLMLADTVKALIERGADLNAKNPAGQTALDLAKLRGSTPVVDLLVKAGAKEGDSTESPAPNPKPASSPRAALERSIPLLQRTDAMFLQRTACVSCHHNTLTAISVATARENGFPVNEPMVRDQIKRIASYIETWRERALQGVGIPGEAKSISSILIGLAAEHYQSDAATDALARFVLSRQLSDGRWRAFAHRPPSESSDFHVTAIALRSLQIYGPKAQHTKYELAVKRATDWLVKASPQTTEERTFHLLGLSWAGLKADHDIVRRAVGELRREQRSDGGWAQLPSLSSDAYATGQALVALRRAGAVALTDPSFQRGIAFLLKTQLEDGSWYVRSRAIPLQPYFESGFPHGHDQWISAAGSNWATTALALAPPKD